MGARERDKFLRVAWRALVVGKTEAERFVFVDEMGANISLSSLYAWSPKGQRARSAQRRATGGKTPRSLRA